MKKLLFTALTLILACSAMAKKPKTTEPEGYQFTVVNQIEATSVKDQSRSGTCWSYAANSFLESELLRQGKGEYDLSEMWVARNTYYEKAVKYVRMHGTVNFGEGGALHDVLDVYKKYGMVPEEAYPGLNYGTTNHNHAELAAILTAYLDAVIKAPAGTLTESWLDGLNGILDAYFGPVPQTFTYQGSQYTPRTFADMLGLDMNDYVSITSFTHHPFYTEFIIEIPDNWSWGLSYNVPLEEMMDIMTSAIENGYSVCWGSDVSEKGFSYMNGVAIVPEINLESMDGTELARWVALSDRERQAALYTFDRPSTEKEITQQVRQKAFDNYETTDDHGMHITAIATDQNGNKYFKVKNSWGTSQVYDGYFYASYPFVAYKTINIIVNKNSIPTDIKNKLSIR